MLSLTLCYLSVVDEAIMGPYTFHVHRKNNFVNVVVIKSSLEPLFSFRSPLQKKENRKKRLAQFQRTCTFLLQSFSIA